MKATVELRSPWARATVAASTVLLSGVIVIAFWYEDLRYSLPTPRPAALHQPPLGTELPVGTWLREARLAARGPVLVHFVNPDCPCSRFNVEHLRALHARFGDRVQFVAAVQARQRDAELEGKLKALDLRMPTFIDPDGRHAAEAGVYSTPQAVLVDAAHRLIYRGNYNTSRYCTDPRTEFVRLALEGLVAPEGAAPLVETPAYGCELPSAERPLATTQ